MSDTGAGRGGGPRRGVRGRGDVSARMGWIWQHKEMLFELRRYTAQPGRRDDLVKIMDTEVIPFQASCGVVVVGSFIDEENPDVYVWIRRFNDEDHRKQLYKAVYTSDRWKNDLAPRFPEIMIHESIQVTRLIPTASSVIR